MLFNSFFIGKRNPPTTLEYLIISGGVSGGRGLSGIRISGGGNSGEVLQGIDYAVIPGVVIPILIGAGGPVQPSVNQNGLPGSDTSMGTLVARGGTGYGGTTLGGVVYPPTVSVNGYPAGIAVRVSDTVQASGGGSGAGGPGENATKAPAFPSSLNGWGGNGGFGITSAISGIPTKYAGGGAGVGVSLDGSADYGGGHAAKPNGDANTGAGAFASSYDYGWAGGSGLVIIAYSDTADLPTAISGSPIYVHSDGKHRYIFTASGSIIL